LTRSSILARAQSILLFLKLTCKTSNNNGANSGWPHWANFCLLGSFFWHIFENWEGSPDFFAAFFDGKTCVIILVKYGLDYILDDFFTNSPWVPRCIHKQTEAEFLRHLKREPCTKMCSYGLPPQAISIWCSLEWLTHSQVVTLLWHCH
jgi:hypothetical protein